MRSVAPPVNPHLSIGSRRFFLLLQGLAMPREVVGFEVGPRRLLAAVDRGDAASIPGSFELGHGPSDG